jgi:hypothetical protein
MVHSLLCDFTIERMVFPEKVQFIRMVGYILDKNITNNIDLKLQ